MAEFVQAQLDYILFVCGLGFIILATCCFTIRRSCPRAFQWVWLGLYALLRGIDGWLGVHSYGYSGSVSLFIGRIALQFLSLLFLTEFARSSTLALRGKAPGRWIHIPVIGALGCAAASGSPTLVAVTRFTLVLGVGAWIATLLWLERRRESGEVRSTLGSAAICTILMTLLGLLPYRALGGQAILDREAFLAHLKIPADVFQSLLAIWLAYSCWNYAHAIARRQSRSICDNPVGTRVRTLTLCGLAIIIAGGWAATEMAGRRTSQDVRESLLARGRTAAAAIDPADLRSLSGSPADYKNPHFARVRHALRTIQSCNGDCRFVYVFAVRKGKVVFLADAEPTMSKDYSPPGEVYPDATAELRRALVRSDAFVEGPASDEWGNWVSSLVSISDPKTGHVFGLIGMDIDAQDLSEAVAYQRQQCILVVLLLCVIAITCFSILYGASESGARVSESEAHYRGLVEGSPNWISLFDDQARFLSINESGSSYTGWTKDHLDGKPFDEVWPEECRAAIARNVKKVLHGDRCFFEAGCVCPNGRETTWSVVLNPVVEPDGRIRRFVGILADIADQKKAEKALQESQRMLYALLGNLPGMAYRCSGSEEPVMEFVSDGCLQLTGYRPSEIVGSQSVRYSNLIHPDDRDYVRSEVSKALVADRTFRITYRIITVSGEEKWVWEQGRAVSSSSGGAANLEGFVTDITERKRAEEALVRSEQRYRFLAENVRDVIWTADLNLRMTFASQSITGILGFTPEEVTGLDQRRIPTLASYSTLIETVANGIEMESDSSGSAADQTVELELVRKDQTTVWTENEISFLRGPDGRINGVLGVARDITGRKRAEAHLNIQTSAINAASDLIVIANVDGEIEFVNAAFERETGYVMDEVLGKKPSLLKSGKHDETFYSGLWKTILAGDTWQDEIVNRRKDGSIYVEDMSITPVRNSAGVIEHFVAIKRNITEKKVYERKLDHLAHHDHLTGLPNRLLFSDRLTQSIAYAQRREKLVAVMFIDLDRFKYINDTLGHNVGDGLLKQVSHRLSMTVRRVDTIARMGGDEFTIILSDVTNSQDSTRVARKVLEALSKPFLLEGRELFISASIGISVYPVDGTDVETLVRNADTAMYHAKEEGRNTYHLYTDELNAAAMERMTMENSLRKALERNEFVVYYQPRVDMQTGKILGAEALVRWKHPEMGLVAPGQFIPLCEETGLIIPLSEWVLGESCRQNKRWQDAGYDPIDIAVNISGRQVEQKGLRPTVIKILKETGLDAQYLDLELTESTLMQDPAYAVSVLNKLKEMGVKISIDDFGTGYSSLSYLKQFPVDAVKIDQSFVKHVTSDPDDAAIAGAVVAMAHSLKLRVIAEGVETLQQLEFLRDLNCDEMQGYFISRPVPADEFEELLRESSAWPEGLPSKAA